MSVPEEWGPEGEAAIIDMLRELHDGFHTIPLTMNVILCHPSVQGRVQHIVNLAAHDPAHFTVKPFPSIGVATVQALDEDALAKMAADALADVAHQSGD